MKTFFDSSAFAKRYVLEKGSRDVDNLCLATDQLAVSVLCVPEVISALNRRVREKSLSRGDYTEAKKFLLEDIQDAVVVNLTPSVVATSIEMLEACPLRAMDALQVACAREWGAEVFVSADQRQINAAKESGLQVSSV